ncbi:hypothetical protein NG697_12380 [Pseudarthrobacter sp. MDT3-26]|uniref:TasA family protein n=1 Tax=Pseudarthrobacter raffinosi TaxID=2953651 RepID=UPI00208FE904|nr:TasA family protein [Pseudarthrobacter sp. MDT3-26]MCO4263708.1 hypothetical protein [Pseudarthrobacter sp. MDT3-26]
MTTSTLTAPAPKKFSMTTGKKIAGSVAIVVTAAALAGAGTFGDFSNSTNASQEVSTGSAGLTMGYNTFNKPVSGFLPGDSVERLASFTNPGTAELKDVLLDVTVNESSALTTDPVNGLQVSVSNCLVPWTVDPSGADFCSGYEWNVVPPTSIAALAAQAPTALPTMQSLVGGGVDNLRAVISLPSTADVSFQNLSAEVDFSFTGTQRNGKLIND